MVQAKHAKIIVQYHCLVVFRRYMKVGLVQFLDMTDIFSKNQFGFREGKNTDNALAHFMTDIYNGLNEKKCISGLFLDIMKAFDTVDHEIILRKLYRCGIRGKVNEWFRGYLLERQ